MGIKMLRVLVLFFLLVSSSGANAQIATLNKAKYIATLKVVANHKMGDKGMLSDFERLRESEKFKKDLEKMVNKLDNSKPNDVTNRKIMRILEQAGKDIYNELR